MKSFGVCSSVAAGLVALTLAGCGDGLSSSQIERSVEKVLKTGNGKKFCLNKKEVQISLNQHPPTAPGIKQEVLEERKIMITRIKGPLELFAGTNYEVVLPIAVMLGDGYAALLRPSEDLMAEGYFRPETDKTKINRFTQPNRPEIVNISKYIARNGGLFIVTEKGLKAQLVDDGTACVIGQWELSRVLNWTEPATDSTGRIVSTVEAEFILSVKTPDGRKIDDKQRLLRPQTRNMKAIKYSDGWQVNVPELEVELIE